MKRATATQKVALLDELYAASVGEVAWATPLHRISQLTHSADAMFQGWSIGSGKPEVLFNHAHQADMHILEHYSEHIANNDPRVAYSLLNPVQEGQVLCDAMFISERQMRRHAYYDYLSDCGDLRYFKAIRRELQPGLQVSFNIQRTRKEGAGTAEHDLFLRWLDSHGIRLTKMMQQTHQGSPLLQHLMGRASYAVFIVDADRRLREVNQKGLAVLERQEEFVQRQDKVFLIDTASNAELSDLLHRAQSATHSDVRGGSMHTARFELELFPLKLNWWDAERSYAIVATKRPLLDALTAAEQRLASGLMQGQTLREYAQTNHISYETARTHLKRVMFKTATHSQAQLVSFLLNTDC